MRALSMPQGPEKTTLSDAANYQDTCANMGCTKLFGTGPGFL